MPETSELRHDATGVVEPWHEIEGVLVPQTAVVHRDDDYDSHGFERIWAMQSRHFWHRGRNRFVWHALKRWLRSTPAPNATQLRALDLGGGCGGWIRYLEHHSPKLFSELALADSSMQALKLAAGAVSNRVARYQADLLDLKWRDEWDIIFLLDVLQHIPEHQAALEQVKKCLRPGGVLFVTAPALPFFASYYDELIHQRRYSRADFVQLADATRLTLIDSRYFMFLLSPLVLLRRFTDSKSSAVTREHAAESLKRAGRIPAGPINAALTMIFALESPLGHWVHFPWGTSILGVFQRTP